VYLPARLPLPLHRVRDTTITLSILPMAAISIPPSPQAFSTMPSRRVPLQNISNGGNSPYNALATAAQNAQKRARSHSSVQREIPYGQPPPAKRQQIEVDKSTLKTPPHQQASHGQELRLGRKPSTNTFEQRIAAIKRNRAPIKQQAAATLEIGASKEAVETIKQWQKHYRRVFPQYVFYFESVPEDVRAKCSKQVQALGAVSITQCPKTSHNELYAFFAELTSVQLLRKKKNSSLQKLLTS
jgi:regulatory subunit for Cdc7p protein kinase